MQFRYLAATNNEELSRTFLGLLGCIEPGLSRVNKHHWR